MAFCTNCGKPVQDTQKFCASCGMQLNSGKRGITTSCPTSGGSRIPKRSTTCSSGSKYGIRVPNGNGKICHPESGDLQVMGTN